jgi:hypothetical protein
MKSTHQTDSEKFVERDIIIGAIVNDEYLKALADIYRPELIASSTARRILGWIVTEFYQKYKRAPGRGIESIFRDKRDGLPDAEADGIAAVLDGMSREYQHNGGDRRYSPDHLLDRTVKYFSERSLEVLFERLGSALTQHDIGAANALVDAAVAARTASADGLLVTRVSAVESQPVRWLWPARIPRGKLSLIGGDPGEGKSLVTLDVAARLSSGRRWRPSRVKPAPPVATIILSAEDDISDTIRPRLEAAGGNPQHVHVIQAVLDERGERGQRMFNLANDLARLENKIRETKARLVIIDPLSAYLSSKVDSHRDAEIRRVLTPLAVMAARSGAAVLAVMHLNKSKQSEAASVIARFQASIAFVAAARVAYLVVPDAADRDRKLFLPVKNNLARPQGGLAFFIEQNPNGQPVITWCDGTVNISATEALDALGRARFSRSRVDEAADLLRELLADGPCSKGVVMEQAAARGISERTLWRAHQEVGAKASRKGGIAGKGRWMWYLPNP